MSDVIRQRALFYLEQIASLLEQAAADGVSISIHRDYVNPDADKVAVKAGFGSVHHYQFVGKLNYKENNQLRQSTTHIVANVDVLHNVNTASEVTDQHVYIGEWSKPIPLADYVGILNRPTYFNTVIGRLISKARDEGVGVFLDQPDPTHLEEPLADTIDFKGYSNANVVGTQTEFTFNAVHPLLGSKAMLKCFSIQGNKETPEGKETWTYIGLGYPALKTQ